MYFSPHWPCAVRLCSLPLHILLLGPSTYPQYQHTVEMDRTNRGKIVQKKKKSDGNVKIERLSQTDVLFFFLLRVTEEHYYVNTQFRDYSSGPWLALECILKVLTLCVPVSETDLLFTGA